MPKTRKSIIESVNFSYWELKEYFKTFDLIVVGSGIVGLSTAISFLEKNKKKSVLVLERGILPNGASTKNAGFACFGSPSELLDDIKNTNEETVWQTVKMRWEGLSLLKKRLGEKNIAYKPLGGFELFDNEKLLNDNLNELDFLNKSINEITGKKNCYTVVNPKAHPFAKIKGIIRNNYEGQLDTGLMMRNLLQLAQQMGVVILNSISVTELVDVGNGVEIKSNFGIFKARKVVVATNGFATQLLNIKDIKPARAQVLITKPINNLKIKGAFHYQQGYYYFRNIDNRILFGGGRNLDFKAETTTELKVNLRIQAKLDEILKQIILPKTPFEVEHRWSGIMGVGSEKKPIIKIVSPNVIAAVRMGGMGVAIGSLVGKQSIEMLE
ncbi:MAG: FAD-dependent oxidoreductase [Bacteroidota bacterium]|nr:FAD-dependent oxidoreductase [Bacteroidota bacterium]